MQQEEKPVKVIMETVMIDGYQQTRPYQDPIQLIEAENDRRWREANPHLVRQPPTPVPDEIPDGPGIIRTQPIRQHLRIISIFCPPPWVSFHRWPFVVAPVALIPKSKLSEEGAYEFNDGGSTMKCLVLGYPMIIGGGPTDLEPCETYELERAEWLTSRLREAQIANAPALAQYQALKAAVDGLIKKERTA